MLQINVPSVRVSVYPGFHDISLAVTRSTCQVLNCWVVWSHTLSSGLLRHTFTQVKLHCTVLEDAQHILFLYSFNPAVWYSDVIRCVIFWCCEASSFPWRSAHLSFYSQGSTLVQHFHCQPPLEYFHFQSTRLRNFFFLTKNLSFGKCRRFSMTSEAYSQIDCDKCGFK